VNTPRRRRAIIFGCLAVVGALLVQGAAVAWHFSALEARTAHHHGSVSTLSFSRDGGLLLSATVSAKEVFVRDLANPFDRALGARLSRQWRVGTGRLSADGRRAVVAETEDNLAAAPAVLDLETSTELRRLPQGEVIWLELAPDGESLAVASSKQVVVHDLRAGSERRITWDREDVGGLAYSADSRQLALAEGSAIELLDLGTGRVIRALGLEKPERGCRGIALSPDGTRAFGTGDDRVFACDVTRGSILWSVPTYALEATPTPDGSYVVFGVYGGDQSGLELHAAATGALVGRFASARVSTFAFSAGGELAATGDQDGNVVVEPLRSFLARFQ
jgi:WD40 repeat protein